REEVVGQPPVGRLAGVVEPVRTWTDLGHQPVHPRLHQRELVEGQLTFAVGDDVCVVGAHELGSRNTLWFAACARGRTIIESMLTFHGRVAIHAMQSAMSSATSGPGTPE